MSSEKKGMAAQVESLKAQRKELHDALAGHVDKDGKPNASAHYAASVASQIAQLNTTIETLENLDEDGSNKSTKNTQH